MARSAHGHDRHAPAFVDERDARKPWFDVPVHTPEPSVEDHHDEVEDGRPVAPIAADDDYGTQPWNDLPPEFPNDDSAPSSSPWTDDIPVADLPRHDEPAPAYQPAPAPWVEAPAASAMPHPYETAAEPWADAPAPAAAFSTPFDTAPSHDAWTETSAHETWVDAPSAAIAVDTLVEPPSIDTSIPEPPERFSGAPPMPPGMRAPGPTPGVPVTPESFMDPRVSFKRRHPVRRLLAARARARSRSRWRLLVGQPQQAQSDRGKRGRIPQGRRNGRPTTGNAFPREVPDTPGDGRRSESDDGRRRWRHGTSEPTPVDLLHDRNRHDRARDRLRDRGTGRAGRFAARRGRASISTEPLRRR